MSVRTIATLLLDLAVIVAVARLLGALAQRLGQPTVVGEILGGVLLGPTFFDGALTRALFPDEVRPSLDLLANTGIVVFMFLVGLELNRDLLRGQVRTAATVSLSSIVVSFALGCGLARYLSGHHPTGQQLAFALFLGTAMSITAFPVLARILTDWGLHRTPLGGLALASASVDDLVAWTMLAVVAALAGANADPWLALLLVPFAAGLLLVVRPLLARLAARGTTAAPDTARRPLVRRLTGAGVLLAVAVGLFLSAKATEKMGLHLIFGAFLFGAALPGEGAAALRARVLPWAHRACAVLLLPVFFMVAGIRVDLSSVDIADLGELALILLVAVGGKCGGAFAGARLAGVQSRHSAVLAVLVNTRGLTELVVLTVGVQLGLVDARLYSLMVVMALVTTAMPGVLLRRLIHPERTVPEGPAPRRYVLREETVP